MVVHGGDFVSGDFTPHHNRHLPRALHYQGFDGWVGEITADICYVIETGLLRKRLTVSSMALRHTTGGRPFNINPVSATASAKAEPGVST